MRTSYWIGMLMAGAALTAAALACSAPVSQVAATPTAEQPPAGAETPQPAETPAPVGETISAGIATNFFVAYTIVAAPGWSADHQADPAGPADGLTLTKGGYALTLRQSSGGDSGSCVFDGTPEELALVFDGYVEITGAKSLFRRGTLDGITHTVCQRLTSGYGSPTQFGAITYTTPNPADPATLNEMDGMVASLTN